MILKRVEHLLVCFVATACILTFGCGMPQDADTSEPDGVSVDQDLPDDSEPSTDVDGEQGAASSETGEANGDDVAGEGSAEGAAGAEVEGAEVGSDTADAAVFGTSCDVAFTPLGEQDFWLLTSDLTNGGDVAVAAFGVGDFVEIVNVADAAFDGEGCFGFGEELTFEFSGNTIIASGELSGGDFFPFPGIGFEEVFPDIDIGNGSGDLPDFDGELPEGFDFGDDNGAPNGSGTDASEPGIDDGCAVAFTATIASCGNVIAPFPGLSIEVYIVEVDGTASVNGVETALGPMDLIVVRVPEPTPCAEPPLLQGMAWSLNTTNPLLFFPGPDDVSNVFVSVSGFDESIEFATLYESSGDFFGDGPFPGNDDIFDLFEDGEPPPVPAEDEPVEDEPFEDEPFFEVDSSVDCFGDYPEGSIEFDGETLTIDVVLEGFAPYHPEAENGFETIPCSLAFEGTVVECVEAGDSLFGPEGMRVVTIEGTGTYTSGDVTGTFATLYLSVFDDVYFPEPFPTDDPPVEPKPVEPIDFTITEPSEDVEIPQGAPLSVEWVVIAGPDSTGIVSFYLVEIETGMFVDVAEGIELTLGGEAQTFILDTTAIPPGTYNLFGEIEIGEIDMIATAGEVVGDSLEGLVEIVIIQPL